MLLTSYHLSILYKIAQAIPSQNIPNPFPEYFLPMYDKRLILLKQTHPPLPYRLIK